MSQQVSQQYACRRRFLRCSFLYKLILGFAVRAQRSVGLVSGSPAYDPIEAFEAPDSTSRTYQYSPDGRLFALAVPSGCVELQY
jgi:hypothetical protein